VGFAYVVRHGDWAYYFNAASVEPNAQHAIQWAMMLWLKAHGVRWYELGWQGAAGNDKERSIEFFRRGFGGKDFPAAWRM
jgi:lipid II:glycine glycyltransferase (peptidoglycan interpeptide bridge formation enzyme)